MPSPLLDSLLSQPANRPAVTSADDVTWTFDQLLAAACETAHLLRPLGGAGRTVLVHARGASGPAFAAADLGVLLAGGVPAVIPEHLTADHTGALLDALNPAAILDTAPDRPHPLVTAARARNHTVLSLTPEDMNQPSAPDACRATAARWAAERTEPAAAVVFTSGTTGTPRGVVLHEQDLVDGISAWRAHWPACAASPSSTVAYLPVAHIAQRIMGHYLMCLLGTTVRTSTPDRLAADIVRYRPEVLLGVPHTWAALAHRAEDDEDLAAALGGIALAVNGAAALDLAVAERLATTGLRVAGAYGATETTVPAFHQPDAREGTLGTAIGVKYRLAEDGELLLRSPYVAAGYVTAWPSTCPVTDRDGWLRTGDRARTENDGRLVLAGRATAAFKTGRGRLVQPEPAEALLAGHPLVANACLIGDRLPASVALISAPATATWPVEKIRALEDELAAALAQAQHGGHVPWADVGRVHVLPDDWQQESLATDTGKPRRTAIATYYAHLLIDAPRPEEECHA
ncbi:AMP-binding protein [Streptomyces sp. NPDC001795]|uniref:AMP-binding protein n=1 Tax=Streptomyces sp. NPDC001795 TaxID=3154525 RepID=UPI003325E5DC